MRVCGYAGMRVLPILLPIYYPYVTHILPINPWIFFVPADLVRQLHSLAGSIPVALLLSLVGLSSAKPAVPTPGTAPAKI